MAKRDSGAKQTNTGAATTAASGSVVDTMEQRVVAFAEQLGRMAGTVQAKAEGWMDRDVLNEQIASVRDSAAELLEHLSGGAVKAAPKSPTKTAAKSAKGRSGGVVDAPGKKHRKPVPNPARGKATDARVQNAADSRIARMKIANASRRRGRG
jgi:hypothetical protein